MASLQCPMMGQSSVLGSRPQPLANVLRQSNGSRRLLKAQETSQKSDVLYYWRIACHSAVAAAPSSPQPAVNGTHGNAILTPKPNSIVHGVVKTMHPTITVQLANGLVASLPNKQISLSSDDSAQPPFQVGEEVWAVVGKGKQLTLTMIPLELLPGELLTNKAAVFNRVQAFMAASSDPQQAAGLEDIDSASYHSWLGSHLLTQLLAPAVPVKVGSSSGTCRANGWYDVQQGQLLQARVLRVVNEMVTLRVPSLGINGLLHISQISKQQLKAQDLPQLFQAGTQLWVLVKKLEPPRVPGAVPKVYFSTRDLEASPGLVAKDLQQYNDKASEVYMQLQRSATTQALDAAAAELENARQAEAVRRRNANVVLTAGSTVSGTVVGFSEHGVLVNLQQPGADRMLLHHRNISQSKISRPDMRKLLPEGTQLAMKVILATTRQQKDGTPQLRPALALAPFEEHPGEFKRNPKAVLQRAEAAYQQQSNHQAPEQQVAGDAASVSAESSAAASATLAVLQGPRLGRLLEALGRLDDVPLHCMAAGSSSTAAQTAHDQAEQFLQLVQEAEQLISASLGNKLPWEIEPKSWEENDLELCVARCSGLWATASSLRAGLMAALLGLRFKASAVRMLQDPAQAAQVLNSNRAGVFYRDMLALAGAASQLPAGKVPAGHMSVILQGLTAACQVLQAHSNQQLWEDAYMAWVHPAGRYLCAAVVSEKMSGEQVLDSYLLQALHSVQWMHKQRALSRTEHLQVLDVVFTKLRKRFAPAMPGKVNFPYTDKQHDDRKQHIGKPDEQLQSQDSPDTGSSTTSRQQQESSPQLAALQSAVALLQTASNVGYAPSSEWWSSLMKSLLLRSPQLLQQDAAWTKEEAAIVRQLKSSAAYLTGTKTEAKPLPSNTQPAAARE